MPKPIALVTGASSGIGRATAQGLARAGFAVIAAARRLDRLQELAEQNPGVTPRQVDLSDVDQVENFCAEIIGYDEPVGVLVNNAGYSWRGVVEAAPMAPLLRMYQVNVFALLRLTQAVLPGMRARRQGRIVNLSSIVGRFTFPGSGPYASTKHAVEAVSDAMRHELLPFGIRVITIRPGPIATEFNDTANEFSAEAAANTPPEYQPVLAAAGAAFGKMFGQIRIPGPEVVAEVIVEAITSDNPKAAYAVGPFSDELLPLRAKLDDDDWLEGMNQRFGLAGLKV
ncbi:MAG: SDR family oxidoreductase [Proteobacteria bacterium]|nr:SDR family oxidoreductase [Pseudomonadota bacterium]